MRNRAPLSLISVPCLVAACSSTPGDVSTSVSLPWVASPAAGSGQRSDADADRATRRDAERDDGRETVTPVRHLIVIVQENVSFDHYFGTYPKATNPPGEPRFVAAPGTPTVNGLTDFLLTSNPNGINPMRVDRRHVTQCDQNHEYLAEQQSYDNGLADKFVQFTANGGAGCDPAQVMSYFDGNTVTALWNYAQHFAMSDNSYNTTFGPSTPGALNLVSGQTHGVVNTNGDITGDVVAGSVISDPQPFYDDCSSRETVALGGKNVGDLLNAKGVTWGWFQGGFAPQAVDAGVAKCTATHVGSNGKPKVDYIPHHEPFQYYASTANPHHLPPSSIDAIGKTDRANHQYDLADFWAAAEAGRLPAVVYLKAPGWQDGHAAYSDPLLEQQFLVTTLNRLQQLPEWESTAVVIAYDDSDGFAAHVSPPIVSPSDPTEDGFTGPGHCGTAAKGAYEGRCGYGPRLPLLVLSPFARRNFVDHGITDQSSILRFIEDNWSLGRIGDQSFDVRAGSIEPMFDFSRRRSDGRLLLDPTTGAR
ncbi:MAG: alkaline phosphatase family protein [Myxococcota bacterium]|nr:alkaline phosphatase family protein [Myxococcota bacterium]